MAAFQRVYSRELEDAVASAALDRGVAPARCIQEDIEAGRFQHDGTTFPAQKVPLDTVRGWIREERQRRAGRVESPLAKLGARDAIETLRIRLLSSADSMLKAQEEKRRDKRDPERMRQIARLIREAAAIPGQDSPRPVVPGQRDEDGKHNGGRTEGGLAAQIKAAHDRSNGPVRDAAHLQQRSTENADAAREAARRIEDGAPVQTDGVPGAQNSERVGALAGQGT